MYVKRGEKSSQYLAEQRLSYIFAATGHKSRINKHGYRMKLTLKDWSIMIAVTVIYAIIAFIQLGSFEAPGTVWEPSSSEQAVIMDLGEIKEIKRISTFGGVGSGKFSFQFAYNPEYWSDAINAENNHVSVFTWQQHNITVSTRYVKLNVVNPGFSIHELAVFDGVSAVPLQIKSIYALDDKANSRGTVQALVDEQHTVPSEPSFMNGTYFDEIYHARTAYEHLEHIPAYESTHPPLGKILIALGIKLFGFSPFGWRIIGTLFGVAMLPLMYLIAKAYFKKTSYAATAIILFAVECMHFTQTRIATIDVYAVFFIMLMFYFMSLYSAKSYYTSSLKNTFFPLALAGVTFGLGIASKWIVFYGGAGLAVMLGIVLYERYMEYRAAKLLIQNVEDYSEATLKRITSTFFPYTLATLGFCILFFVIIPITIYALSYIPVLSAQSSGYTLKAFIDYQVNMFQYHSGLVSSHPFASPWWEWPFMKRPVWYYVQSGLDEGLKSTIVVIGNPLIWWVGICAMVATIILSIKQKDKRVYFIFIAYLAQYIPWMLVSRETFLYHYFAMVPFLILSLVYIAEYIEKRNPKFYKIRIGYVIAAAIIFAMFYPALSGMVVSEHYINHILRWFPSWVF